MSYLSDPAFFVLILALGVVSGAWALGLIATRPRLLLYAIFALLPTQLLFLPVRDFFLSPADLLVCAAGAGLLMRLFEGRRYAWQALHRHRYMLLVVGSYIAGFLLSGDFSRTVIRLPLALLVSILAFELLRTRTHLFRAARAIVIAGALDAAYGLFFILRGTPLHPSRFSGMSDVNFSAMLILTAASVALALKATEQSSRKLVMPGALGGLGLATMSQMGLVAVLLGWGTVLRRLVSPTLQRRIALVGCAALAVGLLTPAVRDRILGRNTREFQVDGVARNTADVRMELLQIAAEGFQEKPILGIGYSNFPNLTLRYPGVSINTSGAGYPTHNSYVEVLVEGGVVTFAFFVLHFLQYFPGFAVVLRVAARQRDSVLAASLVGFPIVLVCAALANVLLLYSFWAVCGLTLAALNVVRGEEEARLSAASRLPRAAQVSP